jgi:modulator of FtsH protease HflC
MFLSGAFFILPQTHQALILQFGEMRQVHSEPGLKFKIPFIQDVLYFDKRLLDFSLEATEVTAKDQKRLVVDTYTRYSIADPLQFYKSVGNEREARNRLKNLVPNSLRDALGNVTLTEAIAKDRAKVMIQTRDQVNKSAKEFGIQVKDVRIVRADLPKQNSEAIFGRMKSARKKEAELIRAEGAEQSQGIRARADKDRLVILAEAKKKSELLRGQGEAASIKTAAVAFKQDEDFYGFYRRMQAYRDSMSGKDGKSTMVLTPEGDFFKHFSTPTN